MMRVKNTHITKANSVTHSVLVNVGHYKYAVVGGNTVLVPATVNTGVLIYVESIP